MKGSKESLPCQEFGHRKKQWRPQQLSRSSSLDLAECDHVRDAAMVECGAKVT